VCERSIEAADDLVDALGQSRAVVLDSVTFGQFVRLPILLERIIVLPDVVKILAERVAQADFVSKWQLLRC